MTFNDYEKQALESLVYSDGSSALIESDDPFHPDGLFELYFGSRGPFIKHTDFDSEDPQAKVHNEATAYYRQRVKEVRQAEEARRKRYRT